MYPYVVCQSCNNQIGHLYRLFKAMREISREAGDENLLEVYKLLGLKNWCCTGKTMSLREFNEFLHAEE